MRRLGAVGVLCDTCLSFVSTGVCERERARVEEKGHVAIAGMREGRLRYGLYIRLSFPLVSLVSERVCERENFPSVVRLRSES